MTKKLAPMHPGEVLREEFLVPLGMSPGALARACGVPRTRIERLASEEAGVTADTALRLNARVNAQEFCTRRTCTLEWRELGLFANLQTGTDRRLASAQNLRT